MISSTRRVYAATRRPDMQKILSHDGTPIAFDSVGAGPPLVLVVGAFNTRETGAALASFLAPHFTVLTYDRRGRGDSGDTAPYAVEREVDDLEALIGAAAGPVGVFGYSSGAVLALRAAARTARVSRVALYDLPPAQSPSHATELASLVAAGGRGAAVEYFQRELVRIPDAVIAQLRHAPFRPALEAMAKTLVYEAAVLREEERSERWLERVRQPTLAIVGGGSPPVMRDVAESLVRLLADGSSFVLEGEGHDLVPSTLGPVVQRFFGP
jgi:pimeloyl-ACP methyl ester carboxylesterase